MTNYVTLAARKYAWRYSGMLAFLIQRVTGLALLGYLFLHVLTIHQLRQPEKFDASMRMFDRPIFKLGEIALLGIVILHALNGVRLTLIDMGVGVTATRQRQMFWYFAVGLGVAVFIAGAAPIFITGVLNR
jgi:succinate dehydrogenase / fumarate reductase, cytochrome b subunit